MKNTIQKEEVNIKKLYGKEATLSKDDFVREFNINEDGLSSLDAEERIHKYGYNEIKNTKPKKWYNYFLESLFTPFNSILIRNRCNSILYRCVLSGKT